MDKDIWYKYEKIERLPIKDFCHVYKGYDKRNDLYVIIN